jgi:hypothetical protein
MRSSSEATPLQQKDLLKLLSDPLFNKMLKEGDGLFESNLPDGAIVKIKKRKDKIAGGEGKFRGYEIEYRDPAADKPEFYTAKIGPSIGEIAKHEAKLVFERDPAALSSDAGSAKKIGVYISGAREPDAPSGVGVGTGVGALSKGDSPLQENLKSVYELVLEERERRKLKAKLDFLIDFKDKQPDFTDYIDLSIPAILEIAADNVWSDGFLEGKRLAELSSLNSEIQNFLSHLSEAGKKLHEESDIGFLESPKTEEERKQIKTAVTKTAINDAVEILQQKLKYLHDNYVRRSLGKPDSSSAALTKKSQSSDANLQFLLKMEESLIEDKEAIYDFLKIIYPLFVTAKSAQEIRFSDINLVKAALATNSLGKVFLEKLAGQVGYNIRSFIEDFAKDLSDCCGFDFFAVLKESYLTTEETKAVFDECKQEATKEDEKIKGFDKISEEEFRVQLKKQYELFKVFVSNLRGIVKEKHLEDVDHFESYVSKAQSKITEINDFDSKSTQELTFEIAQASNYLKFIKESISKTISIKTQALEDSIAPDKESLISYLEEKLLEIRAAGGQDEYLEWRIYYLGEIIDCERKGEEVVASLKENLRSDLESLQENLGKVNANSRNIDPQEILQDIALSKLRALSVKEGTTKEDLEKAHKSLSVFSRNLADDDGFNVCVSYHDSLFKKLEIENAKDPQDLGKIAYLSEKLKELKKDVKNKGHLAFYLKKTNTHIKGITSYLEPQNLLEIELIASKIFAAIDDRNKEFLQQIRNFVFSQVAEVISKKISSGTLSPEDRGNQEELLEVVGAQIRMFSIQELVSRNREEAQELLVQLEAAEKVARGGAEESVRVSAEEAAKQIEERLGQLEEDFQALNVEVARLKQFYDRLVNPESKVEALKVSIAAATKDLEVGSLAYFEAMDRIIGVYNYNYSHGAKREVINIAACSGLVDQVVKFSRSPLDDNLSKFDFKKSAASALAGAGSSASAPVAGVSNYFQRAIEESQLGDYKLFAAMSAAIVAKAYLEAKSPDFSELVNAVLKFKIRVTTSFSEGSLLRAASHDDLLPLEEQQKILAHIVVYATDAASRYSSSTMSDLENVAKGILQTIKSKAIPAPSSSESTATTFYPLYEGVKAQCQAIFTADRYSKTLHDDVQKVQSDIEFSDRTRPTTERKVAGVAGKPKSVEFERLATELLKKRRFEDASRERERKVRQTEVADKFRGLSSKLVESSRKERAEAYKREHAAATTIQSAFKTHLVREGLKKSMNERAAVKAAAQAQAAARAAAEEQRKAEEKASYIKSLGEHIASEDWTRANQILARLDYKDIRQDQDLKILIINNLARDKITIPESSSGFAFKLIFDIADFSPVSGEGLLLLLIEASKNLKESFFNNYFGNNDKLIFDHTKRASMIKKLFSTAAEDRGGTMLSKLGVDNIKKIFLCKINAKGVGGTPIDMAFAVTLALANDKEGHKALPDLYREASVESLKSLAIAITKVMQKPDLTPGASESILKVVIDNLDNFKAAAAENYKVLISSLIERASTEIPAHGKIKFTKNLQEIFAKILQDPDLAPVAGAAAGAGVAAAGGGADDSVHQKAASFVEGVIKRKFVNVLKYIDLFGQEDSVQIFDQGLLLFKSLADVDYSDAHNQSERITEIVTSTRDDKAKAVAMAIFISKCKSADGKPLEHDRAVALINNCGEASKDLKDVAKVLVNRMYRSSGVEKGFTSGSKLLLAANPEAPGTFIRARSPEGVKAKPLVDSVALIAGNRGAV